MAHNAVTRVTAKIWNKSKTCGINEYGFIRFAAPYMWCITVLSIGSNICWLNNIRTFKISALSIIHHNHEFKWASDNDCLQWNEDDSAATWHNEPNRRHWQSLNLTLDCVVYSIRRSSTTQRDTVYIRVYWLSYKKLQPWPDRLSIYLRGFCGTWDDIILIATGREERNICIKYNTKKNEQITLFPS